MKKTHAIIAFLIFIANISSGQLRTQYFDGADTSWNSIKIELDTSTLNVWQIGKPQKILFDSAATLPNAIITDTVNFYPANNLSRFIVKVENNYNNYGIFALRWKQKLDMDTLFDGGIIEYSTDTGNTWVNVFNNPFVYNFYGFQQQNADTLIDSTYAFSGTDTTWRDIWLCFDRSWMQQAMSNDTFLFRFTLRSDSANNNKEGWMIDNMMAHITFQHTIKEVAEDRYFKVFPNPSNNIVHIQAEKLVGFHIIERMELIDPLGRIVDSWTNIPIKFWFDVSKYNNGLYFLKVKTNLKFERIPLVISKI